MPPEETCRRLSSRARRAPACGAQHVRGHGHDLGLVLDCARPEVRVQGVGLGVDRVNLVQKVDVLAVSVVDGAGGIAVAPAPGLQVGHCTHLFDDLLAAAALCGYRGKRLEVLAVGLDRRLEVVGHGVPPGASGAR